MVPNRLARSAALVAMATTTAMVSVSLAGPATASDATFGVTPGALVITVPTDTARLGSVESSIADQVVAGPLGGLTVTDTRGGKDTMWSVLVSASNFTAGGEVVPATNVDYQGVIGKLSGPGSVGATVVANTLSNIATPKQAISAMGLHGNNAVSWSSSVQIHVPAQTLSGVYAGIITHSVA